MSVLVIGGGPAGLATAACLAERGVPYRLVDRQGRGGGAYAMMYDGLTLTSPTSFNELPGLALSTRGEYTTVAEYRAYLEAYVAHHRLRVDKGTVERVERAVQVERAERAEQVERAIANHPGKSAFRVVVDGRPEEARAVVVASGMWDFPRRPSFEGEGEIEIIHAREWRGAAAHAQARILIVGGATTGVEIAEELGRANRTCIVAARRGVKLIPQRVLGRDLQRWLTPLESIPTWLAASHCDKQPTLPATDLGFSKLRAEGKIDVRPALVRFDRGEAVFADDTRAAVDHVVLATGFRYDTPFLPAEIARASAGHVLAKRAESVTWPGLFVVGTPCASRVSSEFLRGVRHDAVLVAERIALHYGASS